ncbi:uncharacterized protein METZ01_LOCUS499194, partial [marine metagenome]
SGFLQDGGAVNRRDLSLGTFVAKRTGERGSRRWQEADQCDELRRTEIPLGMRADTTYEVSETLRITSGDLFALMTDGVEESMSPEQELFGTERVHAFLRGNQSKPAIELAGLLHQQAREHIAGLDQPDDYTTIIVKATEND